MRAYLSLVNPFALIAASALVGATVAGGVAVAVADDGGHAKPAHVRKDDRPARAKDGHKEGRKDGRHLGKRGQDGQRPGANQQGKGKGKVTMDRGGVIDGQGSPQKGTRTSPVAPGTKTPSGVPSPTTLPTPTVR